ncbi:MAG: synthase, small subunit [Parcubacteria group bacterium]|nr:synthase, small subunit [Parcubacteria group bacterium]
MNIALINNGTKEPGKLLSLLAGHDIKMFTLERANEALAGTYDLVVLSGSSRFPIAYNLETLAPELKLIRECITPLLGICFGAELLAVAYGGTLRDAGPKEKGVYEIFAEVNDPLFMGRSAFEAYEAHRWTIDSLPDELEILAFSAMGPEIIRHRTKPQYGFQFHPEKMCDETFGDELFRSLLKEIGT